MSWMVEKEGVYSVGLRTLICPVLKVFVKVSFNYLDSGFRVMNGTKIV